jgi:hypothetical protein
VLHYRTIICLAMLPLIACAGGATCWPRRTTLQPPPPVAFQETPTLEDVLAVVNSNSQDVRQLQTEGATLSVRGLPALRADVALERPRRFRMRAELLQLTGPEIDLGSNDELFWMWIKRNPQPGIYFARHAEFAASPMRRLLPIEPNWLSEAFGLVQLDPRRRYEGPFVEGEERLWIRSRIPGPQGEMAKVTVVHRKYGYVIEQHLYDERGRLLAKVEGSDHRYYSLEGVSLPHRIQVQFAPDQPTQLAFQLDVSGYRINQLQGDVARLFELPRIEGQPLVNLADPRFQPAGGFLPTAAPSRAPTPSYPAADFPNTQARYRGYGGNSAWR